MKQQAVGLTQRLNSEFKKGWHTWSELEGDAEGEEGLLPEGAGDAAGAAPGRALSTPCNLMGEPVSMERKDNRAGGRARRGGAGQSRAGKARAGLGNRGERHKRNWQRIASAF